MTEEGFYSVYSYGNHLEPSHKIKIEHSISFNPTQADLSDLTELTAEALEQLQKDGIASENAIYKKLCAATAEWERCGANTLRIAKALEYVKTREVPHTANVWTEDESGVHTISNRVYLMHYRIYENTRYNRELKKSVPVAWDLSWWVSFNTPHRADGTAQSSQIAGQDRKRYTDKALLEKYLQGRIGAYSKLFIQLSPPIPAGQQ